MVARQVRETLIWTVVSVSLCLGLLGLDYIGQDAWLRLPMEGLLRPWLVGSTQLVRVLGGPMRLVNYWQTGSGRIADLEERLTQLSVEANLVESLQDENELLRSQLHLEEQGIETIAGVRRLVGKPGLWVHLGSRHGLAEGQLVLDEQGALVGRLNKVGVYTSAVQLPSDSAVSMTVAVRKTGVHGVLRGQGNGAALTEVLQSDSLVEGDVLVTSGEDGVYPPGLVVGIVEELVGDESAVTKGARVRLLANTEKGMVVAE